MERSLQRQDQAGAPGTRERVIEAAGELFATRGFAGASISAIQKASGVFPSSMYWEFGNKQGILAAVLEDSAGRWLEQSAESHREAMRRSAATGAPTLDAYFHAFAGEMAERPEFLRLLLLLALERREVDEATIRVIRQVRTRAAEGLVRVFRIGGLVDESVDDEVLQELARLTLAFADGAFVAAQVDPGTADLKRMFSLFLAGMVSALAVEGPAIVQTGRGNSTWEPEQASSSSPAYGTSGRSGSATTG